MSSNKDKGTQAETAVVNLARASHWPNCERRALGGGKGTQDRGDIAGIIGVTIQVKNVQAQGPKAIADYRAATLTQMDNNKDEISILVLKPKGIGMKNAGQWDAHIPAWKLLQDHPYLSAAATGIWFRVTLEEAFRMLHGMGY